MEWIEATLYTTNAGIEIACAMLLEAGIGGLQIEDDEDMKNYLNNTSGLWDYIDEELLNREAEETNIKFYVSDNEYGMEMLLAVREGIKRLESMELEIDLGRLDLKTNHVNDEEWLNNWKKYYKPFEIGNVVIRPVWEEYENVKDKIVFTIDPGHVFGTGLHQTTQLCIEQLEKYVKSTTKVLDLGCGSGILSIIALLLGASSAFAIDIDANAVDIAYENAKLNNIDTDKYTVVSGNVLQDLELASKIAEQQYEIVVANIVADVIISISELAKKSMTQGGVFIASGIISERLEDVKGALLEQGLDMVNILQKDDWICLVAKKI